ncbi:hypothetical protein HB943_13465 [Listeria weihenstephanensis]|uniref:Yip1 domain-containing protein n=1 Tax=Listeria weihenstephanensis TaxID=1006155 RepID=A0A841Z8S1_9LIST|nr:hypothetical protein [Listeria weihenstephanensis]MBC1501610.1 hypothetical protein [Listeria weihenstephanensis]
MIRDYATFLGMTIVRPVKTSMQAENRHGAFGLVHVLLFVLCLTFQYGWNMKDVIINSLQGFPVIQRVITTIFVSSGQVFFYILVMMLLNIMVVWLAVRYVMGIKEVTFFKCAAGIGGMMTVPLVIIVLSLFATWWVSTLVSVLLCIVALLFLPFALMYFIIGHYEKSRVDVYWISLLVFILVAVITIEGMVLLVQIFTSNIQALTQEIHQNAVHWIEALKAKLPR